MTDQPLWRIKIVAEAKSDSGRYHKVQQAHVYPKVSEEAWPDNYIAAMRVVKEQFYEAVDAIRATVEGGVR